MIFSRKVRNVLLLALYVGLTIATYAIVCHFMHIEFQDIHLLYAALVGCIAYLPRFIIDRKQEKKEDDTKRR